MEPGEDILERKGRIIGRWNTKCAKGATGRQIRQPSTSGRTQATDYWQGEASVCVSLCVRVHTHVTTHECGARGQSWVSYFG